MNVTHRKVAAALVLCVLGGPVAYGTAAPAPSPSAAQRLGDAPDFELTDLYGDKVRLSDFRGQIVALHFWAKWCASCKVDLQYFQSVHERFGPDGVVVLGLAYASGSRESIAGFANSLGVTFTNVMADDDVLDAYGVASFPANVVVDRNGEIRHVARRLMDQRFWNRIFEEMLAEGAD